MVPNGWENKTLESLCDPDAPITYGVLKPGDYVVDGIPLLQIKDLLRNLNDIDSLHRISPELDHEYRRSRIATNDILISLVGTVGRLGLVPKEIDGSNIHRNLGRIRTNNYEFLIHYLNSDIAKNQIGLSSSGSSQSALNLTVLRALKVPVPPLPEQRKIASILGTWDKAISATERLIDNSKQQKKALMQQLLTGKKRLLDDLSKPFEGEWEEIKLGDVCSKVTDGAHHSPKSVDNGYPMYSVKDMKPTGFAKNTARLISDADFLSLVKQNCKPEINDILIAKDGSILKYCFVVKEEVQGVILSSIALLRPKLSTIQPEFIAQYFSQESIKYFVGKALTSGSGVPRIILKDFKGIHLKIPTIAEQQKISLVLINADNEIELLEQQLADLKQEKKALMQQLLTGKRRVKIKSQECIA